MIILTGILFISACNGKVTLQEFEKKVRNSNDYRKTYSTEEIKYQVQYKPVELMVLGEAGTGEIEELKFNRIKQEYDGYLFFDFSVEPSDPSRKIWEFIKEGGPETLGFLSYNSDRLFYLETEKEAHSPEVVHFEKGPLGDLRFTMMFLKEHLTPGEDLSFVFEDILTGFGPVRFKYNKAIVYEIPKLKFYENKSS